MTETLIVHGRWLITGAGADDPTLENGAVAVQDGEIQSVARLARLREQYPGARELGGAGMAIMPGLINAHHHSHGASNFQHGIADRLLESWLIGLGAKRPGDNYLEALLSAGELLRSGVTSVVDVISGGGLTAPVLDNACRQTLEGYAKAGIRMALAPGISDRNRLLWADDQEAAFIASLPSTVQPLAEARLPGKDATTPDEYLALVRALHRDYRNHPRIDIWFGPPGPGWVSDGFLERIAEAAGELETRIQTHALESFYENLHGRRLYGQPTLLHLRDLGLLNPRFSIAHGVWLSEAEIQALADSGAAVSHNPSSNLRLRAGVAPLQELLMAGVTVGLGMDGTTLNDDEDMFTELRLALRLAGGPRYEDGIPDTGAVFALATDGGARLMGQSRLGRLAPGYRADLLLLDLSRICWPWVAPEADPQELLLMRARRDDVDTVLVDGQVVVAGGEPTSFDRHTAGEELARRMASTPRPAELALQLGSLLAPVEDFYRSWEVGELHPYRIFNSRR